MTDASPYAIRRVTATDAAALAGFYNALSPSAIRTFQPLGLATTPAACEPVIAGNFASPDTNYDLVAWREGRIVGWGFFKHLDTAEPVFGLAVGNDDRGQGLGSRLMDAVMDEARRRGLPKVILTVVTDNTVAWKLYASRGFVTYDQYVDARTDLPYFRMAWLLGGAA